MLSPPGCSQRGENLVFLIKKLSLRIKASISKLVSQIFFGYSEILGFKQSMEKYALFTQLSGKPFTVVFIYVDDMIITGNYPVAIATLKRFLHKQF